MVNNTTQNTQKSTILLSKIFSEGAQPLPRPYHSGEGAPPPHTAPARFIVLYILGLGPLKTSIQRCRQQW